MVASTPLNRVFLNFLKRLNRVLNGPHSTSPHPNIATGEEMKIVKRCVTSRKSTIFVYLKTPTCIYIYLFMRSQYILCGV